MRRLLPICFLTLLLIPTKAAFAGANAGGTLLLHANPAITFTVDATTYCGQSGLSDCLGAVVSVAGTEVTVFYVVAAFPAQSSPRLAGVSFGVEYGEANLPLLNYEPCSDFELPGDGWPGSGSGTAVTWNTAQTPHLVEVYWFAAYNYDGGSHTFALAPHPTQGAFFADDSVPSVLDPIVAMGTLGFATEGVPACPDQPLPGGCCFQDLHCEYLSEEDCVAGGGTFRGEGTDCSGDPCGFLGVGACCDPTGACVIIDRDQCPIPYYQGDGVPCNPNPCPQPRFGACCLGPTCEYTDEYTCSTLYGAPFFPDVPCDPSPCAEFGACCVPDGQCFVTTESDCLQYEQHTFVSGSSCDPNPCPDLTGACCLYGGGLCQEATAEECAQNGGEFFGAGTVCIPSPCVVVGPGACCIPDYGCIVTSQEYCDVRQGQFFGAGSTCEPNPCPGACCLNDGSCVLVTEASCEGMEGQFLGVGSRCDPNPCAQGSGACCLGTECFLTNQEDCLLYGGSFLGEGVDCSPNPCAPIPTRPLTWGSIKRQYGD